MYTTENWLQTVDTAIRDTVLLHNKQRVEQLQVQTQHHYIIKKPDFIDSMHCDVSFLQHCHTACNAQLCNSYGNSVCSSVTRWYPIQMNEDRITRFSLWGSNNTLVLWHQQWFGSDVPFHLKFALKVTHPSEKLLLRPISAYNVSTVRAREKSSIIVNRKSATHFPTS